MEGKTKGFIKTKSLGWMADSWRIHGGFMANGFAEVDNGFGYEKWYKGGV